MQRSEPLLTLALAALVAGGMSGCIDFGYHAPPAAVPDAGEPQDGEPMNDDGCVEGPTMARDDGPQIHYYALDVDQHLLNIHSGQTVTWINASPMSHTATAGTPSTPLTAANGGFDSGSLAAGGGRFAWTFCAERTITWFCRTHPAQMFGYEIVVGP